MPKMSRDELIEWCSLMTGYNKQYYEKMSTEELETHYQNAFLDKSNIVLEEERRKK